MKLASSMKNKDFVKSTGNTIARILRVFGSAGTTTINIAKFLLYDVTVLLSKLPFGNFISVFYFMTIIFVLKNISQGGGNEFNRLIGRAIHLYVIQKKTVVECFAKLQLYLLRILSSLAFELKQWTVSGLTIIWNRVGVKQFVKDYAKNVILENADIIEKRVAEIVETSAFASVVNTLSQKLISELSPTIIESYMRQSAESTAMILENDIQLNQKMTEIAMQLEYLRKSQPDQFREIIKTVSLSSLVLNDAVVPSSVVDIVTKWTGKFSSSASQQGRTRIENGLFRSGSEVI
jgi:hypothetical protein